MTLQVGVLALQGDFQAHAGMLARLGVQAREVRRPAHLEGLHGVILPGGESTTMWTLLEALDMGTALRRFAQQGGALYGTCAGVILLAREIHNPQRSGLGLLDIIVERNGYGRQTESRIQRVSLPAEARTEAPGASNGSAPVLISSATTPPKKQTATEEASIEIVLIRAPRIVHAGATVRCRLLWQGNPLWVEQDRIMGTTFHPELGNDVRFHQRFLALATAAQRSVRPQSASDPCAADHQGLT